MNNVTFGDENVGYYETVAGGAGAVSVFTLSFFHRITERCRFIIKILCHFKIIIFVRF